MTKRKVKSIIVTSAILLVLLASLLLSGAIVFLKCGGTGLVGGHGYRYDPVGRNPYAFIKAFTTITAADDYLTVKYKLGKPNCELDSNSDKGLVYDLGAAYIVIEFDWKDGHFFRVLSAISLKTPFYTIMRIPFKNIKVPALTDMPWLD